MIDPNSMIPMYEQLAALLGNEIVNGTYKVGDRLPCEQSLSEMYSLSRVTVRHALSILSDRGLVVSRQGKGTFVADSAVLTDDRLRSASFFMNGLKNSILTDTTVLDAGPRPCPRELCDIAGFSPKGMIGAVTRLRSINKTPAVLEYDYFPASIAGAASQDLQNTSLISMLEHNYGLTASVFENRIGIVKADRAMAGFLRVPEGTPLVRIREKVFQASGELIYFNEQYIRDDIYEYTIKYTNASE